MKKYFVFLFFCVFSMTIFGQSGEVTNAILSLNDGLLTDAKTSIDKAAENEKTINEPKTWYYRGKVYEAIAQDPTLGKQYPDAIKTAFDSYEKAKQLDLTAAKPGKFKKDIDAAWAAPSFAISIQNAGITAYQNKDYDGAYNYFTIYQAVKSQDTLGYVYAAQMALAENDYKKAKETYVRGIEKTGYVTPEILSNLIYIYKNVESEKDYAKALEIAQMGKSKYPGNLSFAAHEIDLLDKTGKLDEAIAKQEEAVLKNPSKSENYLMLGSLYEKKKETGKAKEAYGKALSLNPNSFEANYNMGAMLYNPAVEIIKEVRGMGVNDYNKKGKQMEAQAKEILKESLPYFEKAYQLKPDDSGVKKTLKEIYNSIGQPEKAAGIK
jgi:tetratricopeptide (TPR) repeat protein